MSPVGSPGSAGSVEQIIALRQQIIQRSRILSDLHETRSVGHAPEAAPAADFGNALRGALDSVSAVQAKSSALSEAYERGETTDIAQVMLARQEAGVAFETTLQVRNKLLAAYQETMRMGV